MRGDFQVRFRERLGLKCPCLLDYSTLAASKENSHEHKKLQIINEYKQIQNGTMTKPFLILALLIMAMTVHAQVDGDSTKRTKEFLITTTSLTSGNYGLQYKVKVFRKAFLRLGLAYVYDDYRSDKPQVATSYPTKNNSYGFSFTSGLEKRKVISDFFEFSYGLNLIMAGGWNKSRTENPNIAESLRDTKSYFISPGISVDLGAIMKIHQNFYLGAEIMPQLLYSYQDNSGNSNGGLKTHTFRATVNSQNAILALIYRFK
jgi:hypothetical protein